MGHMEAFLFYLGDEESKVSESPKEQSKQVMKTENNK